MKSLCFLSFLLAILTINAYPQDSIVSIPDTAFLHTLINAKVDTNGDSLISFSEAAVVANIEIYSNTDDPGAIKDLTGIEAFHLLDSLSCTSTSITSLDVSANSALTRLDCRWNQLTGLGLSENTALVELMCEGNKVSSLDVSGCEKLSLLTCYNNELDELDVSTCSALEFLECGKNNISRLNVSGCKNLSLIACYNNQLASLDISTNAALKSLECGNNMLSSLDVSANTALISLECFDNQLTSLDVSKNTDLNKVSCSNNFLINLDVSANSALELLFCNNNLLSSLDISQNDRLRVLGIEGMTSLKTVCVWEIPFPPDGTRVDDHGSPNVTFTKDCSTGIKETCNNRLLIYPNPTTNILNIEFDVSEIMYMNIISADGKHLLSTELKESIHKIDISFLPKGLYYITFKSDSFVATRKIMKL